MAPVSPSGTRARVGKVGVWSGRGVGGGPSECGEGQTGHHSDGRRPFPLHNSLLLPLGFTFNTTNEADHSCNQSRRWPGSKPASPERAQFDLQLQQ